MCRVSYDGAGRNKGYGGERSMISEQMFKKACKLAGAKQVSKAALVRFNERMNFLMETEARKCVMRMAADRRVRVEPEDIGE
jgi:histone H3/H4